MRLQGFGKDCYEQQRKTFLDERRTVEIVLSDQGKRANSQGKIYFYLFINSVVQFVVFGAEGARTQAM